MSSRLAAAMEARKSGDLSAISHASGRVIALGLADMAKLRLDEKDYQAAGKLCRESLEFEDTAETRVELAIVSLYAKKPTEAAEQASLAIEKDPGNGLAWDIKGESLLQTKDFAGATKALARSVELKQTAESLYALGVAQLGTGEKEKAAQDFDRFLALTGEHGWSRVLVGQAYQEAELPKEAEAEFRTSLQLDPHTPDAHYYWALTLLKANAWNLTPEGKSQLQEELKNNPNNFLADYVLGFFASNERNYEESDRYLHRVTKLNPSFAEAWLYLGLNAHDRGADHLAEMYLRKAIALTKNESPTKHLAMRKAYFALGRILSASGRKKESEEFFQKARELQKEEQEEGQRRMAETNTKSKTAARKAAAPYLPETDKRSAIVAASGQGSTDGSQESGEVSRQVSGAGMVPTAKPEEHLRAILGSSFNDLATAEALQEKYSAAVQHYREAETWDPQIPGLQRNLGLAEYFAGNSAEAVHLLARVVAKTPDDAHARAVLGMAYCSKGDFASARRAISPIADRALQDAPLGLAWAKSLAKTGDKGEAARILEALEKSQLKFSAGDLNESGELWEELGQFERAERAYQSALLADPTDTDAKRGLGITLMQLSKPQEASELLRSILADHPNDAEAHYQLGCALLRLGNLSDAVGHLEEAVQLEPTKLSFHRQLEAAYRKAGRIAAANREHAILESLKNQSEGGKDSTSKISPK